MAALAVLGLMTAGSASAQQVAPDGVEQSPGSHDPIEFIVTQVGIKEFTTITFEGGFSGMGVHAIRPTAGATFSANSLLLIDVDAGGSGNTANEPSPETVAFWLTGGSVTVIFSQPTSEVSLLYSSSVPVSLQSFDAGATPLQTANGLAQFNDSCGGDPAGAFCNYSLLSVSEGTNLIASVTFSGGDNATVFDNFKFRSDLIPVADDDDLGAFVPVPAMDGRFPFTNETVDIPISLLLANDTLGDAPNTVTVTALTTSGGNVTVVDDNIEYTSGPGFGGDDTFEYTLTDDDMEESTATVTVTVDATVSVVEVGEDDLDAPFTALKCAGDPVACGLPFNWVFEGFQSAGDFTLEVACCTFPAVRETMLTFDKRRAFFDPVELDVRAEILASADPNCADVTVLLNAAADQLVMDEVLEARDDLEILLRPWQRVSPNPIRYPEVTAPPMDGLSRYDLYNLETPVGETARAGLEWGACAIAFDGSPDGIALTDENTLDLLGFEVDCDENDVAYRPLSAGTSLVRPEEDFPFVRPWSAQCDGSRSGRRSSHLLWLLNMRIDTDLNGPKSTVNRVLGDLRNEITAEQDDVILLIAADSNPMSAAVIANTAYLEDLDNLEATLVDAKSAINEGRRNVRRGGTPLVEFQLGVDILDDFVCQALALEPRENNSRGLFTGRGMNAKFMTCSYDQFPGGYIVDTQCLINPKIENTILDRPGVKCPIGP